MLVHKKPLLDVRQHGESVDDRMRPGLEPIVELDDCIELDLAVNRAVAARSWVVAWEILLHQAPGDRCCDDRISHDRGDWLVLAESELLVKNHALLLHYIWTGDYASYPHTSHAKPTIDIEASRW